MSIPKDKKRVAVTLHSKTVECMDDIISLQDTKFQTYSQIIDIAVVYFYLAINGYTDKKGEEENHEKN